MKALTSTEPGMLSLLKNNSVVLRLSRQRHLLWVYPMWTHWLIMAE